MTRARVAESVLVVAVVAGVGWLAVRDPAASWPEWVFGSCLALGLLALGRRAVSAAALALREQRRARLLGAASAEELAARAVAGERVRLGQDIETAVRTAVERMGRLAEHASRQWERDPVPALRQVGVEGRQAVSELRRLLGLLRGADADPVLDTPRADAVPVAATRAQATASALAVAAGAVAVAECLLYPEAGASSAPLTVAAAVTVALAPTRPGLGVALCAGAVTLGALVGLPVTGGLWLLLGVGPLTWAAVRRLPPGQAATAVALLFVSLVWSHVELDPGNATIVGLLVVTAAAGGLAVRCCERRAGASARDAAAREAAIASAVQDAVRADALRVARDLHDVVSNAVGVMVLHAGAAESLRHRAPQRARASLDVVRSTATTTLAEVDGLTRAVAHGALGTGSPTTADAGSGTLPALVRRLRDAGVDVTLRADAEVPAHLEPTVRRLVQEALTNVVRHAPGAAAVVTVRRAPDGSTLAVEVTDDGSRPTAAHAGAGPVAGAGYGLAGCAERVVAGGGRLSAGPRKDGPGFRLRADLPVDAARPADPVHAGAGHDVVA